ncbi:MAG TPA: ABC transporter permease [Thermomicrobiales bacterium]|nr:ABC transporter permease [Thermomicrobiales bacterium]
MTDRLLRHIRPEQFRELILLLITIGVMLFFWTQIPNYFDPRSINRLTVGLAIPLVVAVGQMLVVLTRNIDLSVSSTVGLSAYAVGTFLGRHETSPWVAALLAIAIGVGLGAINGLLVAYGGVPAIITTLGTLALYRVLLVEISNAKTVTTNDLPEWMGGLPSKSLLTVKDYDLRLMAAVALIALIGGHLVLRFLPYGRRLYAIGSNPDAAKVAGIPAQRDVFLAFVICGGLAGLGGFLYLIRFGNITVTAAQGLELQVVAAVVVGGVSILGGQGSMFGVLLGVVLIEVMQQSLLRWSGLSEFVKDAILGLLILIAITVDAVLLVRLREAWVNTRRRDRAKTRLSLATEGAADAGD